MTEIQRKFWAGSLVWLSLFLVVVFAMSAWGQERERITYQGFPGGLNTVNESDDCLPTQLRTANNVSLTKQGYVFPRGTFFYQNRSASGTIYTAGAVQMPGYNGSVFYAHTGRYLFAFAGSAGTAGFFYYHTVTDYGANPQKGQIVFFNNYLVHGNGVNYPQYINVLGLPASSTQNTTDPVVNILTVHNNRIFGANSATNTPILYETQVDSYNNWASGSAWNVSPNAYQAITGLGTLRGTLYIFTRGNIFQMTGYAPAERTFSTFTNGYGTIHPDSIKPISLTGGGEGIFFISSAGEGCFLNEAGVQKISEYVQPTLDAMGNSGDKFVAEFDQTTKELWIITEGNFASCTSALRMFADIPYQSSFGTRWPFATVSPPAIPNATPSFSCLAPNSTNSATDKGLYVGIYGWGGYYNGPANATTLFIQYPHGYPNKVDVINQNAVTTDLPFSMAFRTRNEDAGDNRFLKGWRKAIFQAFSNKNSVSTFTMDVSQVNDFVTQVSTATISLTATSTPTATNFYFNLMGNSQWTSVTASITPTLLTPYITRLFIDYVKGPKIE